MRKIYRSIYSILVSRVIISKRAETKYLLEYFSRYLYYLSINKDSLDGKLGSSNNIKLYKKLFDTKISELGISEDREDDKIAKNYILLEQRLEL